jgi:hypothetical protein
MSTTHGSSALRPFGDELSFTVAHPPAEAVLADASDTTTAMMSDFRTSDLLLFRLLLLHRPAAVGSARGVDIWSTKYRAVFLSSPRRIGVDGNSSVPMSTSLDEDSQCVVMEPLVTRTDRMQTLEAEVAYHESHGGWRLRSKTPTQAHLVRGEPISHGVHVFFSIATVGLWLIVYIPLLIFGGEKHRLISIDDHGRVSSTDRPPEPELRK